MISKLCTIANDFYGTQFFLEIFDHFGSHSAVRGAFQGRPQKYKLGGGVQSHNTADTFFLQVIDVC